MRSVSGRRARFRADVVAFGLRFAVCVGRTRSVSDRFTCLRDDVVAFGLCVSLVCFRYDRGMCRVG